MMPFTPLRYRVVGQDDYMLDIQIDADGAYRIDCGDHASHEPRRGRLSAEEIARLTSLIDALGAPREHPAPAGATGFIAELALGAAPDSRVYRFWEGALEEEADLVPLIRALEVI